MILSAPIVLGGLCALCAKYRHFAIRNRHSNWFSRQARQKRQVRNNLDLLDQPKVRHCPLERLDVALGHGGERQPKLGAALAHQRGRGFDGNRVGLDE